MLLSVVITDSTLNEGSVFGYNWGPWSASTHFVPSRKQTLGVSTPPECTPREFLSACQYTCVLGVCPGQRPSTAHITLSDHTPTCLITPPFGVTESSDRTKQSFVWLTVRPLNKHNLRSARLSKLLDFPIVLVLPCEDGPRLPQISKRYRSGRNS